MFVLPLAFAFAFAARPADKLQDWGRLGAADWRHLIRFACFEWPLAWARITRPVEWHLRAGQSSAHKMRRRRRRSCERSIICARVQLGARARSSCMRAGEFWANCTKLAAHNSTARTRTRTRIGVWPKTRATCVPISPPIALAFVPAPQWPVSAAGEHELLPTAKHLSWRTRERCLLTWRPARLDGRKLIFICTPSGR